jgi:hypothetical protein
MTQFWHLRTGATVFLPHLAAATELLVIDLVAQHHPQTAQLAGRLINQTVTVRTITRSRHPRTGITASLLHLSTTTELLVINLVPQHDPQPNPEFSRGGNSGFPQTLLH